MTTHSSLCQWRLCHQLPYQDAWSTQQTLREQRIAGAISDQLLLLEHPPTITLGRLRGEESLRHSIGELVEQGVTVIRSNRGGDATLHAPGQLVGYLIWNLSALGCSLPVFVERLADVFIDYLKPFGIEAHYDTRYPGVWVGERKIVAFGFHLQQGVTMHGFAMNFHTDLSLFDLIVPCGLTDKGVASLAEWLKEAGSSQVAPTPMEAAPVLAEAICAAFGQEAVLWEGERQ